MSISYTNEDDPFALASDQKLSYINAMSGFQWVSCENGIFMVELVGKGHIRVEEFGMGVN